MTLRALYDRDIDRRIDPVATVSELDPGYVEREIEEYFFTDTLFGHLHTFLSLLAEGTDGRTGVWINGYYGSGKSHLLKYIYYCLTDAHGAAALDHYERSLRTYEGDPLDQPVTEGQVRTVRRRLDRLTVDPVMFNIKAVTDEARERGSVTKAFYHQLNAFRGYNKSNLQIARFEKQLDEAGRLDAFRAAFQEAMGEPWDAAANDAVDFRLEQVLAVADQVADLDLDATRRTLERTATVTTEAFVDELERFLAEKPDDYRLVYLVDEVSQYMQGEPNLLVDLQTIIEEVGSRLGDRMWVVCTAQQELKELVEDARRKQQADYSYGKIMGRFDTYLPLESQQADLITRKRVLDKSPEGGEALRAFYREHQTAIANQFRRGGSDRYRGYDGEDEFVAHYPFVPYQFTLLVEVIRAFEAADFFVAGVSSTERSLIGNTHHAAKACKDEAVGYFVPFDQFYNAALADKLTHRARSIIGNALQLPQVASDSFAQRVTKALFLLSNLRSDQSLTFPATADNIAFVLIDTVDPDWAELKRRTQAVLDYLADQNVISESNGTYRFLQEEEIRVKREILNHKITQHDRLKTFAQALVQETLAWSSRADLEGTTVPLHLKVDDHEESSSGAVTVQVLVYGSETPENLALARSTRDLVLCLHEAFGERERERFNEAVQIRAYVQDHVDRATGEHLKAINTFAKESQQTLRELRRWFEQAMATVRYVSAQQVLSADAHGGPGAQGRYEAILDEHLRRVYHKRDLATGYAGTRTRLREVAARSGQQSLEDRPTPAETEVDSFLTLTAHATVADVMRRFTGVPYGWKDTEIAHVLLSLEARHTWAFKWNSESCSRTTFAEKAVLRGEQASLTIHQQEAVDPQLLSEVVRTLNHTIFNDQVVEPTTDPKQLAEAVRAALRQRREGAQSHASDHRGRPFAVHYERLASALGEVAQHRDAGALFQAVIGEAEALSAQVDRAQQLTSFWERHGDTYEAMRALVRRHEPHFDLLEPTPAARARKLATFVQTHEAPYTDFRTYLDYYEAVQEAIESHVARLRAEATRAYEAVFDALEQRRDELGVRDVLPDRQEQLGRLRHTYNLAALQHQLSTVSDFRARYLARLNDARARDEGEGAAPPVVFNVREEISRYELSSEGDVEAFTEDLREKLLAHVGAGAVVIIK